MKFRLLALLALLVPFVALASFSDVPSSLWYEPFVCVALSNSIVEGYPDGTFKGEQTINYAEAAKIIINAYGYITEPSEPWYQRYTDEILNIGAKPPTVSSVGHFITRGEMAYMIEQVDADIYKLLNEQGGSTNDTSNNNTNNDNANLTASYTDYLPGDLDKPGKKLLFFWAGWCPLCKTNNDRLLDLYANNTYDVTTLKINYDTETALKQQFSVLSQDTFILVDENGAELERISSPLQEDLENLLQ